MFVQIDKPKVSFEQLSSESQKILSFWFPKLRDTASSGTVLQDSEKAH